MAELKRIRGSEFITIYQQQIRNHPERTFTVRKRGGQFGPGWTESGAFVWNGEHVVYCDNELIPGDTVVVGGHTDPIIVSAYDFVQQYDFTNKNPITMEPIIKGSYWDTKLQAHKKVIMDAYSKAKIKAR